MKRAFFSLVAAFWFGGALFLMLIAAPAAFGHAPDSSVAGNIVGAMLDRWHVVAIAAPALLLVLLLASRTSTRVVLVALIASSILAASQMLVDRSVHQMRSDSPVAIGSLSKDDPIRKKFGMLHGGSSILLLAQILGAAVVCGSKTDWQE